MEPHLPPPQWAEWIKYASGAIGSALAAGGIWKIMRERRSGRRDAWVRLEELLDRCEADSKILREECLMLRDDNRDLRIRVERLETRQDGADRWIDYRGKNLEDSSD